MPDHPTLSTLLSAYLRTGDGPRMTLAEFISRFDRIAAASMPDDPEDSLVGEVLDLTLALDAGELDESAFNRRLAGYGAAAPGAATGR